MAKRIDVSGLDVYYGDFKAVEDVSMTVQPRSVTAFIGPSGCGKSTLLRTLNRMHEVIPGARVSGKVLLDDQNLYADDVDPVAVRRTVGMVFQRPNPFPTMSIYDNVAAGLRLNGVKKKADLDEVVERSLTRAACCMVCVTMMIVYSSLSCWMRSSMASVEIGSSAEHGASMSRIDGSKARARAMATRCCMPPDSCHG